jgi:undecaprenyl-diphosphatase
MYKETKQTPETTHANPAYQLQPLYIAGLASAILMFGISAILARLYMQYMGWEVSLFHAINNWPDSLRPLFLMATVGHESLLISLVVVAVAFLLKYYKLAWQVALLTFVGYGATGMTKLLVDRGRPGEVLTDLHARTVESGAGFSSGHMMIIMVVALCVLPYLPRLLRWVPFALAGLMAISRVYLGAHAPLDVVGGFAVGLGTVCFFQILPLKIKLILRLER